MALNYRITDVYARGVEIVVRVSYWDDSTKEDVETAEFPYPGDAFDDQQLQTDIQTEGQRLNADPNTAVKQAAQMALKLAGALINQEGVVK